MVQGCSSQPIGTSEAAVNAINLSQFVLYAQESITLGKQDKVEGGDVGVATATSSSFGPQLVVGASTTIDSSQTLYAPTVSLAHGADVGNIDTTTLTNSGATYISLSAFPSAMPLLTLGRLSLGGANVLVGANTQQTITPGMYGVLTIGGGGTLTLSSGAYTFTSVSLADSASFVSDANTTVGVSGSFMAGASTDIEPVNGAAQNLVITVSGNDASSPTIPAASVGAGSHVKALMSVPHGTLDLADHVKARGAFSAFAINVGDHTHLTYQKGLSIPPDRRHRLSPVTRFLPLQHLF